MIIDKLKNLFSEGAAKVVDSVGNALDKNFTTKEEREAAKLELTKELNRHLESMENNAKEITLAEIKDLESARNREIQIATSDKAPLLNKIISPLLALLILGSCFLFWYQMLYAPIPKEKEAMLAGVTGSLTTLAMGVVGYYFGSSQGSANKQKQIDKMLER